MESLIITPKNKSQEEKIIAFLSQMGIEAKVLTIEDKEDVGLLRAMEEGEVEKGEISVEDFLKNLRNE